MKRLVTALLSSVVIGSMLLSPVSASALSPVSTPNVVPYAALCPDCNYGQIRYVSTTTGPWLFRAYVPCTSGDPRYNDTEEYRIITRYYACDYCGSGSSSTTEETQTLHNHAW